MDEVNKIVQGDCLEVLRTYPDNSFDSLVTDPPAGIEFMRKEWDSFKTGRMTDYTKPPGGNVEPVDQTEAGFKRMGALPNISQKANKRCQACGHYAFSGTPCKCEEPDWELDTSVRDTFVAFMTAVSQEIIRVLKPGAYGLVWAIPRTSHWTAWALESAGFEIRDCIYHAFGSGFPKNHDVSKAIEAKILTGGSNPKAMADARAMTAQETPATDGNVHAFSNRDKIGVYRNAPGSTWAVTTDEAREWMGWGTAMKPAMECWWLVRKPLQEPNVASQVLKTGTGALNIDGARIPGLARSPGGLIRSKRSFAPGSTADSLLVEPPDPNPNGRWPSHFLLSHSADCKHVGNRVVESDDGSEEIEVYDCSFDCPVRLLEEQAEGMSRYYKTFGPPFYYVAKPARGEKETGLDEAGIPEKTVGSLAGGGADANDPVSKRFTKTARNVHPTVKPIRFMQYLVKLVTKKGGLVLDPFAGSGTTCIAAVMEGSTFIGIEREAEYVAIARARTEHILKVETSLNSSKSVFEEMFG